MSIEFTDEEREAVADALAPYTLSGVTPGDERISVILTALAPKVEARVRQAQAEAWDEGRDAGHLMARALNPEWPEQTPNPYRVEAVR